MRDIIIDTDPGIDDAVALAVALFRKDLSIKLITTVSGNVSLEKTTKNALRLLEFFHKTEIPVAAGASEPLIQKPVHADQIHGDSGLDGYEFPEATSKVLPVHAVEAMKQVLINAEKPVTLVTIGPLTNIALLFAMYPESKKMLEQIVLMGGSTFRGNISPYGEFNIYADPEAADKIFGSGIPIVMCGCDIGSKAIVTKEIFDRMKRQNRAGRMLCSLFECYRSGSLSSGLRMFDLCTIAYLVRPDLFETKECFVGVELNGTFTRGSTSVDLYGTIDQPINASVLTDINVPEFQNWLLEQISLIPDE